MEICRHAVAMVFAVSALVTAGPLAQGPAIGQETGSVRGTVTTEEEGTAVSGATVSVEGQPSSATTDARGTFVLDGLPLGEHTLVVSTNGFTPLAVTVTVTDASPVQLELLLTRELVVQEQVSVTAAAPYRAQESSFATRTAAPILDTPLSLDVVPETVLLDQQAVRIEDGLRNIASFQPNFSFGLLQDSFILRGFTLGGDTTAAGYREGVRLTAYNYPTAALQRVEVLKGPASALYGRVEPGGVINVVPLKPSVTPQYTAQIQMGSNALVRPTLSASGPLVGDELFYRVTFDYLDRETFRDFVEEKQVFVAPTLVWSPGDATRLEVEIEYRDQEATADMGIPVVGDRPADIPVDRFLGVPEIDGGSERRDRLFDVDFSQDLSSNWQFRYKATFNRSEQDYIDVTNRGLDEETGIMSRGFFANDATFDTWYTSGEAVGRFQAGRTQHTLVVGMDHYRDDKAEVLWFTFADFGAVTPINIYDPVYVGSRVPNLRPEDAFPYDSLTSWSGFYAHDELRLGERWIAVAGARYDRSGTENDFLDRVTEGRLSPRFGLVFKPTPQSSVYGNYNRGFGPNNGRSATNEPFDPELSEAFEIGLKTENSSGSWRATVAAFNIVKQNVLTDDPSTPDDPFDSIAVGEARSRGLELGLTGQVASNLAVIGSYAFTSTEITEDNSGNAGNRFPNAPLHAANIWLRYQATERLAFGGGLFAVSERQGDEENTFIVPAYGRVDLMARYRLPFGMRFADLQVNVNNLLDETYYLAASDFTRNVAAGASRTVQVMLRFEL